MEERDIVFRDRLIALMTALKTQMQNPVLRKRLGLIANELVRQGGARSWADLKERADGPSYDSLLNLFHKQAEQSVKVGDDKTRMAVECLAISLIARRQYQADLVTGVQLLDGFIADSEKLARRLGLSVAPTRRADGR